VEELERRGHSVDIYCIGSVSREQLAATFHKEIHARIFCREWLWPPGSTIYDYPILATLMGGYSGYDFVFEAIGPVIHLSKERMPQLVYVFFPPDPDLMGDGKFRSGFWRVYSTPYRIFYKMFSKNVQSTHILSISEYVACLCKEAWGMDSQVVYFPVSYGNWEPVSISPRDGVITIGRFSPEKNQAEQITIAETLDKANISPPVRIVGAVATSLSHRLYQKLRNEIERKRFANVTLHPNLPQGEAISLAQSSKVFLHTMRNEHFGIAVVEAIAAGCVPIVHDSGGTKEIVPVADLRFRTTAEAVDKVRLALDGEYDGFLPFLRQHISKFSEAAFKSRVTDIIVSCSRDGLPNVD